ncbi:MAG: hypothetical protein H7X93_13315 [Sphingomonadaceae bacterium]|nr:hypothetical protein [Sphingomonadaceae bacterium]
MRSWIWVLAVPAIGFAIPAPAQDGLAGESFTGPNEVQCRRIPPPPGSRLGQRNVCMTRAEWRRLEQEHRDVVQRQQDMSHFAGCPPPSSGC